MFRGTGTEIPDKRFGLHETVSAPDPTMDWYPFYGVGSSRNRQTILRGKWMLNGSIPDIRLRSSDPIGKLLAMGFGRFDGTNVLEGLKDNGNGTSDERIPSFTMQIAMRDTDGAYPLIRNWEGGKINRLTLSAAEGEELRLNLDEMLFANMAHNIEGVSKSGSPHLMNDPGAGAGGRYVFAGAEMKVFGVTILRIRRFALTLDNQIEPRYYLAKVDPNGAMTQVPTEFVEGKRKYVLTIDMDVADPSTDLTLFKFFMNEGAQGGGIGGTSGPTIGGQVIAKFNQTPGEGGGSITITCGGLSPSPVQPAGVVTAGKINVPAPPTGFFPSTWQLDVDSTHITII